MERIGVVAYWKDYDRDLYLRAVQLADELGYDSFWVPEAWGFEIFSLLTEMAVHTERIKLGTGIVNVFSRTPGLLAMHAATLDVISEGRFMLGLGTSAPRVIEGFHGIPFKRPLTRLRDVIRVVRTLLEGGNLNEAGAQLADYRHFNLAMQPVRSRVPIYVAALKPKSIRNIGAMADGWIPTFWPYDQLKRGRALIAEGAAEAGRDPSEIETAPFTTVLPLGKKMGGRQAQEIIAFYIAGMGDYYRQLLEGFGFVDECARVTELYRDRQTRRQAPDAVSDAMIEALTIAGSPRQCIDELRRRRDFGIDLPILNLPNGAPWPVVEMFLRAMAPGQ